MFYKPDWAEAFRSTPIPHPFSFHYRDQVWKGVLLCREGVGVLCPPGRPGEFEFQRHQKVRDCFIQVEGRTVYMPKMVVHSRHAKSDAFLYCFRIESILPQEQKTLNEVYDQLDREQQVEARR
ncbi:MAG: hypothetical protein RI556_08255 [Hydrogenovibrio sp.]|uniref:hypothetical protein n=1 Tax=Hydrogenovibrio sp. TaxID=2065821 RepID=UPI002870B127|nr:hypothetical protein [Hydrogenovibrio sp.]MDR9499151.1 hypothetical protein [Hydrogenovibrio sp.]